MSETAQNPAYQDADVAAPRVRLRIVLALLRVLAGPRGHARVRWWGGGFAYDLRVERRELVDFEVDADPEANRRDDVVERLRAHLVDESGG